MYSNGGITTGCSISFNAIGTTSQGLVVSLQGSITANYYVERVPFLSTKVSLIQATKAGPRQLKLSNANIATKKYSTEAFKQIAAEDGLSRLSFVDMLSNENAFTEMPLEFLEGSWVTASPATAGSDVTVRLPKVSAKDSDPAGEFLDCYQRAMNAYISNLEE